MNTRTLPNLLPLLMLIVGGALLPAQFATNSTLAGQTGSVVLAAAISYLVGALFLVVLLAVTRQKANWAASRNAPWWAWMGGVIGSAYVVGSVVLTQQLGAALATTLVIASQLVTATLFDHFGVLGLPRRPLNPLRAAAIGLALAALALRFWSVK